MVSYHKLVDDFLLGDRRMAERTDIRIRVDPYAEARAELRKAHRLHSRFDFGRPRRPFTYLLETHPEIEIIADYELSGREDRTFTILSPLIEYCEARPSERRTSSWRLGWALREVRESLSLSRESVASEVHASCVTVSRWESGGQSPGTDALYRWCHALGLVCPPETALVRVVDFSPELLRFLQDDPTRLRSLTPDDFERFVAERLDRMGYNVTLTGATNLKDGGIDLIAVPRSANLGSIVIAGQVKHHGGDQKTGRDAVDRLLAWKDSYFGVGLLVTNTSFTHDAVWTAQQERNARFLRLRDFMDLKRWLQDQWGTEEDWREIPDRVELAPGVVIEIPRPRIAYPLDSPGRQ